MSPRPRFRTLVTAVVVLGTAAVTAGCGATITMPDVVGMRLDDAHRTLEALEATDFEDTDVVGGEGHHGRSIDRSLRNGADAARKDAQQKARAAAKDLDAIASSLNELHIVLPGSQAPLHLLPAHRAA